MRGDNSALWCFDLQKTYLRYAEGIQKIEQCLWFRDLDYWSGTACQKEGMFDDITWMLYQDFICSGLDNLFLTSLSNPVIWNMKHVPLKLFSIPCHTIFNTINVHVYILQVCGNMLKHINHLIFPGLCGAWWLSITIKKIKTKIVSGCQRPCVVILTRDYAWRCLNCFTRDDSDASNYLTVTTQCDDLHV